MSNSRMISNFRFQCPEVKFNLWRKAWCHQLKLRSHSMQSKPSNQSPLPSCISSCNTIIRNEKYMRVKERKKKKTFLQRSPALILSPAQFKTQDSSFGKHFTSLTISDTGLLHAKVRKVMITRRRRNIIPQLWEALSLKVLMRLCVFNLNWAILKWTIYKYTLVWVATP